MRSPSVSPGCRVAVIWIDWYAYHTARFAGLASAPTLSGQVAGIELIGGVGVHEGLKFRVSNTSGLPIETLLPTTNWSDADKWHLSRLLWRRLSELNPEVVLVPGYYTLPALASAVWARMRGRTSVLMTESTAFDHTRSRWKELLKGLLIRGLFDWAVTGGKHHVDYLKQLGFPEERIAGFYDVVDNEMFRQGTLHLRFNDTASMHQLPSPYFLYVGRLAEEKNLEGLLAAWLTYRAKGGSWPLVLVGDGPERQALRAMAAQSSFSGDVFFPGLKAANELLPFYAFAGCFILPSTREPWGLVVNEAMAASLPVIVSTRCGCAEDLVDSSRNGYLFEPEDTASLTRHMQTLEDMDLPSRGRMGDASAEIIRGYTPRKFGLSVASILDAVNKHSTLHPVIGGNG